MPDSLQVSSMTGFARVQGGDASFTWIWELKSVNGRGLDLRCRLPQGWELLEPVLRRHIGERLQRGNLQISLNLKAAPGIGQLRVNQPLLEDLLATLRKIQHEHNLDPPRLDGLLSVRGVIETTEDVIDEEAHKARETALLADFDRALDALAESRRAEGQHLAQAVTAHLVTLEDLVGQARRVEATRPEALRARLRALVEELLQASPSLPEERLAQETALLVAKVDVREELDRLDAHVAAARELLDQGGAVGRRLDFLCQEFNREANTLCSKSADVALTRLGLQLKNVIDQLREQVQNIE